MQGFSFPKGMLLGAASAATQIEGGEKAAFTTAAALPWRMTTTPAGVRMRI